MLIWGLGTTRSAQKLHKLLQKTKRDHVVRMMGLKRRVDQHGNYEAWLEYHIRPYRAAKIAINNCEPGIAPMLKARCLSFIGHVARFGQGGRDLHFVKRVLLWRCLSWWGLQHDFNETIDDEALHFPRLPKHPEGRGLGLSNRGVVRNA